MEGNTNKPSVRKNDIGREIHKAITPIFSGRAKQYKHTYFEVFVFSAHEEHGYSRKSLQEYYRKKVQRILL